VTAPRLPLTPRDYRALDKDPQTSAARLFEYAPHTMDALIRMYCEAYADDAPPGRHVETATLKGDEL
jgi:hypothetical protein